MKTSRELKEILGQIKTPAYVFSGSEFRQRAKETSEILGPDVKICYSIKANPFLLAVPAPEFSAVEVCSPGELSICTELGVDPETIIYSGLNKGRDDIARAIDYGAGELTAESMLHLEMINSCAAERNKRVRVLVRASAGSQFGIDRKSLPEILADHEKYPAIDFAGIHFFTGTQKRKTKEVIRELEFLERYIAELREASGLPLRRIEYGAGLPAYMFCDKDISSQNDASDAELEMLKEIAPHLRQLVGCCELMVEMGRFFAAPCGHYFTKIVDTKTNDEVNYAVIDGGSHQIRYYGQMQGMQIPLMDHLSSAMASSSDTPDTMEEEKWTIAGSLCTTADVLARNVPFDVRPSAGDVLVFHRAGAYALYECMSLFLSRDMPRIYLLDDSGLSCVRDRIESNIFNRPEDNI